MYMAQVRTFCPSCLKEASITVPYDVWCEHSKHPEATVLWPGASVVEAERLRTGAHEACLEPSTV